ncbi:MULTISPECIES: hypothetical protein [Prauserella salsuginis group]|uniref:Excreted virulence factor EspC, type VII ESX diderm n=1 Tax=Prauserella salsuginis TaxID=387889 RepID=A0ABW6G285_9PSEU|nr:MULTISPECIES: hypothetical protein [Prauserella salsuginis group]MCR3719975.1 Protein of unknown function (DUF2580) [Prauserella flava]MCR3736481.1 Protein of unknown function (DUF2580) [Prauserella salsuginis]
MAEGDNVGAAAFAGAEASASGSTKDGGFWDQATFAVKGAKGTATADGWAMGAVTSGAVAGGFMMDPETAEGMVRKGKWIANQMRENYQRAGTLIHSDPPATDTASLAFQSVARGMFELGSDALKAQWQRYTDIAEKLQKALDVYHEVDEQAGKDAKKSSGGMFG